MEQCDHVCIIHDDRWGNFHARCVLGLDHEGRHEYPMNACTPVASLTWEA